MNEDEITKILLEIDGKGVIGYGSLYCNFDFFSKDVQEALLENKDYEFRLVAKNDLLLAKYEQVYGFTAVTLNTSACTECMDYHVLTVGLRREEKKLLKQHKEICDLVNKLVEGGARPDNHTRKHLYDLVVEEGHFHKYKRETVVGGW